METPRDRSDVLARIKAHPVEGTAPERRAAFEALVGETPALAPVRLGAIEAFETGEGPPLLWFHGGGYVFGSPRSHGAMAQAIASGGVRVVMPVLPLAPEEAWPAMRETALAAMAAFGAPLAVGGASAGGHLALTAALERPEAVAALALLSPNTDRSGLNAARAGLSTRDAMNDDAMDTALARIAFGERAADDPDVSPVLRDLSRLPRTHVEVGACEVLLGDALALAERAALAGAPCGLTVTADLFHLAALWPGAMAPAAAQLHRLGAFVRAAA